MISKSTINQVFETARVEEVIGDFVQLKKSGSNFKGLSPFSDERTPSFMVSPVKQIWKDFSSGKGGNVVSFLMEHEHFSYPEAIKYLAKKYNIEIEETVQNEAEKAEANARESMYLVSQFAQDYFQNNLLETEEGKAIGLSYFKERGFTNQTINTFNLGYSLDQWEAFTKHALQEGYQLEFLEQTGLTIVKNDKQFDRFKGRVMFPIHSLSGRVLGFGGRLLKTDKKAAKYLNSPESEIYHKSKILYGIYQAKKHIAKEDNCYLVEGYTDVIQLHQTGLQNVVASSGTALTPEQIRLINRLTQNITVLFDGDAAGLRASLRGIDLILEQGMNVRVCTFPEGEDPDSFAKQNTLQELTLYLETHTQDFIRFKASILTKTAENDPIKKAETITDIVNSIAKIPDAVKREVYIKACAQIMDISEEVLFSTLAQIGQKNQREANKQFKKQQQDKAFNVVKQQPTEKVDVQYELERKIIELLLLYGTIEDDFHDAILKENDDNELVLEPVVQHAKVYEKIYMDLQQDEMEFTNNTFKTLYFLLIDAFSQNETLDVKTFVNTLEPSIATEVTTILMYDDKYQLDNWEGKNIFPKEKIQTVSQLVSETLLSLRCFLIDKKVDNFKQETQHSESDTKLILEEVKQYINLKHLLSRKLNRVL